MLQRIVLGRIKQEGVQKRVTNGVQRRILLVRLVLQRGCLARNKQEGSKKQARSGAYEKILLVHLEEKKELKVL